MGHWMDWFDTIEEYEAFVEAVREVHDGRD